ncbi:MAG: phage holin family protein [Armatimonadota bacterium]
MARKVKKKLTPQQRRRRTITIVLSVVGGLIVIAGVIALVLWLRVTGEAPLPEDVREGVRATQEARQRPQARHQIRQVRNAMRNKRSERFRIRLTNADVRSLLAEAGSIRGVSNPYVYCGDGRVVVTGRAEYGGRNWNLQAAWGEANDVAMVYYPQIEYFGREEKQAVPPDDEQIAAAKAHIERVLSVTADHPNTLGYWTVDEIENQLYKAYGQWEQKKDLGLSEWIVEQMQWMYDAYHESDPDAYVMPTIAWWTTYEALAPIYDVNVPNTYAQGEDLFKVTYDAICAADAIRKTDAHSFVFMPACYDTKEWPHRSRSELRYSFFAPIINGAMGLLPWRLGRASMPYRRAVIYPIMREVDRCVPWLLGQWHNEKVTSTHDATTAEYLKELPKRVKIKPGEEDDETVKVDCVPDVSHCLRRRPDNTYLLLAASNLRKPAQVTFTISDIPGLPDEAWEMIDYGPVPMDDGTITETFEPFGVRAYRITPK